jgi:hypothetical protein
LVSEKFGLTVSLLIEEIGSVKKINSSKVVLFNFLILNFDLLKTLVQNLNANLSLLLLTKYTFLKLIVDSKISASIREIVKNIELGS